MSAAQGRPPFGLPGSGAVLNEDATKRGAPAMTSLRGSPWDHATYTNVGEYFRSAERVEGPAVPMRAAGFVWSGAHPFQRVTEYYIEEGYLFTAFEAPAVGYCETRPGWRVLDEKEQRWARALHFAEGQTIVLATYHYACDHDGKNRTP